MSDLPTFDLGTADFSISNLLPSLSNQQASTCPPGALVEINLMNLGNNKNEEGITSTLTLRGIVICNSPEMNTMIIQLQSQENIQNRSGGYTMIPLSKILSTNVICTASAPFSLSSQDSNVVKTKLEDNIRQREKDAQRIGANVTPQAQQLFFAISKTLDCVWKGTDIVVMDDICIKSPYTSEQVTSISGNSNSTALLRIRDIVNNQK